MITNKQINFYKEQEDTGLKIDCTPKHVVFDHIKEIEFKFNHHKNSVFINEVYEIKVDLDGDIIIKCLFSPGLYNRLGEGSIVSEMIIKGCAVDIYKNDVLEFETSFNYVENKNVIFDFNTEGSDMTIYFSTAHKD